MNRPIPDAIANAPKLPERLVIYYEAFWVLSSCRSIGFGVGPIPWTAVHEYCQYHGFDYDMEETMHHHVRAMDGEYMTYMSEKQDGKSK